MKIEKTYISPQCEEIELKSDQVIASSPTTSSSTDNYQYGGDISGNF